jgi:hypothetical protein
MVKIEVYEPKNVKPDKKLKYIAKGLPSPAKCLRWILLGPTGSGKTNIIKNVVFGKTFGYRKYYDEIYCFIGSLDDVKEMEEMVEANHMGEWVKVLNKFDNEAVTALFNDIESTSLTKKPPKVLFIFDDQICNELSKKSSLNIIDEIWIRGRHCFVSAIISTQKYMSLNDNVRGLNISHMTIFAGTTKKDLMHAAREHSGMVDMDEMYDIFKGLLKEKYSSVTIDNTGSMDHRIQDSKFNHIDMSKYID